MENRERFMLQMMHRLSETFKDKLVLKGGMLLRLLNSPRSTQDIDYVFLSKESRKVLTPALKEVVESFEETKVTSVSFNSKGIFLEVIKENELRVLLEIQVTRSLHLPTDAMSTQPLANQYALQGRIIRTIALPEAFSNKIAATLERDVMRDLYDLSLFEPQTNFDKQTLIDRLKKVCRRNEKPRRFTFAEVAGVLQKKLDQLSEAQLKKELFPLLPEHQREGLLPLMRASIGRIINRLQVLEEK